MERFRCGHLGRTLRRVQSGHDGHKNMLGTDRNLIPVFDLAVVRYIDGLI